jgi:ribosomal subunit interface protein
MALQISGKNVDIGEALRSRIDEAVTASLRKYFDGGYTGRVTVTKDGHGFETECAIHLDTGVVLEASGSAGDAPSSFTLAAERLGKRLRRYHRRLKDHKRHVDADTDTQGTAFVLQAPSEESEIGEDYAPAIVAETRTIVRRLSVSAAVVELDMTDAPVVVFRNSAHGGINVVYRRRDGHFGWIDPTLTDGEATAIP